MNTSDPRDTQPDPARGRFAMMQVARLVGVFLVLFGILLQDGRIALLRDAPRFVGYLPMIAGMAIVFVMPVYLARRWRSPKE